MQRNLKGLLVLFIILFTALINLRETNSNICFYFLFWETLCCFIYKQLQITKFLKVATVYVRKKKTLDSRSALYLFCRALLSGVTQWVPILMPDFDIKKNQLNMHKFFLFLKQYYSFAHILPKNISMRWTSQVFP